jgi:poly(A) polymerase
VALAATRALAPLLPTLSGERVAAETLKVLGASDPAGVVALMRDEGVLAHFLPEARNLPRLARLTAIEKQLHLRAAPPRRLAALLESEAAANAVAGRFHLSNALRDRILQALAEPAPNPALAEKARRALRYRLPAAAFRDRALLAWAGDAAAPANDAAWRDLVASADWEPPSLPIRAQDALKLGAVPGPALGDLMRAMERWWIESDFTADRTACLAELKQKMEKGEG